MKELYEMAQHQLLGPVEPRTWLMGSNAFEKVMPHHAGIAPLWDTKWKFPVSSPWLWRGRAVLEGRC